MPRDNHASVLAAFLHSPAHRRLAADLGAIQLGLPSPASCKGCIIWPTSCQRG